MSNDINIKIDEALLHYYLEADKDIIANEVKEAVQDIDKFNSRSNQIANQIQFLARATANKQRNEYLLTLVGKFQEALEKNIEKPVAMLKQLIQGQGSFVLNKNLDKLTKEEIIDIIKDKNLVELLEQLDNVEDDD
jgi:hypothetical protein